MFAKLNHIYHEFPNRFWIVVGVSFIDSVGGTLLFPFFSLYLTQRFGVGMTQAGIILGIFSISGLIGGMIGGALTDKLGRRKLILFGLIFSALSTLTLGLVNEFSILYPLAVLIGLLSVIAGPAHQAMIADILPEGQRQEGFGIMRVVANLAWMIGPIIGGFIADRSYLALFIIDAVISCVVALLFFLFMPETAPSSTEEEASKSMLETFRGYGTVIRDSTFVWFLVAGVLMNLVYTQMYNSLSVFLRDVHGIDASGYGLLMATSAVTVIIFQFWLTRRIKARPPFLMMAVGTVFYLIGFTMFGLISMFILMAAAIVIITIGEMIIMPTSSTLAANFAPEAMRGRYMAIFGFVWSIPSTIGPSAAGLIIDNASDPNLLWYIGGGLCFISIIGYLALHKFLGREKRFATVITPEGTPAN
ncbi:MAG: MFS transporter [Anaerolineales bacterium]|nr:MFS transporter [Anaerolineales bacterium]